MLPPVEVYPVLHVKLVGKSIVVNADGLLALANVGVPPEQYDTIAKKAHCY